jgi:hypothetical protein
MNPSLHQLSATFCIAVVVSFAVAADAAGAAEPAKPTLTSLELPRLQSKPRPGALPRLAKAKVSVDDLAPQGAGTLKTAARQNVTYLSLPGGAEWSRPLRGSPNAVTFVSFLAGGSEGTTFQIGGAKIVVKPSTTAGYAQLALGPAGNSTLPLMAGDLVKLETHDGASLAALPIITVRLDPAAKVWDLYIFQRLIAEDLPLGDSAGARTFAVTAGKAGANLLGLVLADENPLHVDANVNGIDDEFEKQKRDGTLLAADAQTDRKLLAAQWKEAQRGLDAKSWPVRRPVSDEVARSR